MSEQSPAYATVRRATSPAFGYIISILGHDYLQDGTLAEAQDRADAINARCAALSPAQVRALYRLGAYDPPRR